MRSPSRGAVFVRGGKCPSRASGAPAFCWRELGRPKARSRGWLPLSTLARSEGTERRKAHSVMSAASAFALSATADRAAARRRQVYAVCANKLPTRPPSGAPFVAISVPGAVLPGADPGGFWLNPIRRAFARLRPCRVQPLKAVPRSGDGRRPEASRVRGYEPRPRAPPLLPFQQRPAGTPLGGEGERNISLVNERCQAKSPLRWKIKNLDFSLETTTEFP